MAYRLTEHEKQESRILQRFLAGLAKARPELYGKGPRRPPMRPWNEPIEPQDSTEEIDAWLHPK